LEGALAAEDFEDTLSQISYILEKNSQDGKKRLDKLNITDPE
jgi:hypothetical protein